MINGHDKIFSRISIFYAISIIRKKEKKKETYRYVKQRVIKIHEWTECNGNIYICMQLPNC